MADWLKTEEIELKGMDKSTTDNEGAQPTQTVVGAQVPQDAGTTPAESGAVTETTPSESLELPEGTVPATGTPAYETSTVSDAATAVRDQRIPKSRFDDVNNKRKEAEAERKRLQEDNEILRAAMQRLTSDERAAVQQQQQPTPAPQPTSKDLRQRYHNALLEGDIDTADAIADDMDAMRRREIETDVLSRARQEAQQFSEQQHQQQMFTQTLQNVLADFPQFAEGAAEYDENLTLQVMEVAQGLMARGKDSTNAMLQSVALTTRAYGIQPKSAAVNQPPTQPQIHTQHTRQPQPAVNQPPNARSVGAAGRAPNLPDVSNMTYEDFEALPKDVIARLKGM